MTYISFLLSFCSFFPVFALSVCRHVRLINVTIFSVEALPWNLIVQHHWRWGLSIEGVHHVIWWCVLLASSLQAHRSADKSLARCLYSNGVVQAVTFGYLIYWLVLVLILFCRLYTFVLLHSASALHVFCFFFSLFCVYMSCNNIVITMGGQLR